MNKQLIISIIVVFFIPIFYGCSTTKSVEPSITKLDQSDYDYFYQEYQKIDLRNLTPIQKQYLQDFKDQKDQNNLSKEDQEFIEFFPWINAKHLSKRDKIFLMQVATEIARGVMSSM